MLVIGLTGPTGSGKGTVARLFSDFGLSVIDADEVYHNLLLPPSPCLDELTERFGIDILHPDGTLNRRALGAIVFSDAQALADLNHITHRFVMERIHLELDRLRALNTPATVIDAPQLFEAGADRDCNIIVSVLADTALRMERIMRRDGIDSEAAKRRIEAQKSDAFFRSHSDYIIENNENLNLLLPAVERILLETGVRTE